MTVEADIFSRLSGYTTLAALISTRVYPSLLPQNATYPAVSYRRVSSERPPVMGDDTGIVRARFQFDAWAQSYSGMIAVKELVREALQRYHGTATVEILETFILMDMDLYEDDTRIHHGVIDVEINYRE